MINGTAAPASKSPMMMVAMPGALVSASASLSASATSLESAVSSPASMVTDPRPLIDTLPTPKSCDAQVKKLNSTISKPPTARAMPGNLTAELDDRGASSRPFADVWLGPAAPTAD